MNCARARSIRALSPKPVTCAHELSSKLDAPRRALTAALNARLTPQIRHLIEALSQRARGRVDRCAVDDRQRRWLADEGARLRSNIRSRPFCRARRRASSARDFSPGSRISSSRTWAAPPPTSRSCPAVGRSSAAKARWSAPGAPWSRRSMCAPAVSAATARCTSTGSIGLRVGPRKAMPLSLLAHSFPGGARAAALDRGTRAASRLTPTQFAFRNPDRAAARASVGARAPRVGCVGCASRAACRRVVRSGSGLEALRRLADAGLATARGLHAERCHARARSAAWVVPRGRRVRRAHSRDRGTQRARRARGGVAAGNQRTHRMSTWCAKPAACCWPRLWPTIPARGARRAAGASSAIASSRTPSRAGASRICCTRRWGWRGRWSRSARRSAPTIPRWRAGSARTLSIPTHAAVCNAVGAVAGVVSQTVEILVNQPTFKVFRVHDPAGSRDYADPEPALEHARRVSRELALAAARRAGAADPHVETSVSEKTRARGSGDRLPCGGGRALDRDRPAACGPRRGTAYRITGISPASAYRIKAIERGSRNRESTRARRIFSIIHFRPLFLAAPHETTR